MCDGVGTTCSGPDPGMNIDSVPTEANEKTDVVTNHSFKDVECLKATKVSVMDTFAPHSNSISKNDSVHGKADECVPSDPREPVENATKCCTE